jgi:hypothetical protein
MISLVQVRDDRCAVPDRSCRGREDVDSFSKVIHADCADWQHPAQPRAPSAGGEFGLGGKTQNRHSNTELAIHALDQVHCWDAYFRLRIGHYENFTPLNFQPLLFSKQ